jgi:hypothetical protein
MHPIGAVGIGCEGKDESAFKKGGQHPRYSSRNTNAK